MDAATSRLRPLLAALATRIIVIVTCFSSPVTAADFDFFEQRLQAPFKITHPLIVAELLANPGREILVLGVDDDRQKYLALYAQVAQQGAEVRQRGARPEAQESQLSTQLTPRDAATLAPDYRLHATVALPDDIYLFDVYAPSDGTLASAVFLSHKILYRLRPEALFVDSQPTVADALEAVAEIDSLAQQAPVPYLRRASLLRHLDGNPHPEVVIDGLHDLSLVMNLGAESRLVKLPIKPDLLFEPQGVSYSGARVFAVDSNMDGRKDLLRAHDGHLEVYLQSVDGTFIGASESVFLPPSVHARPWWYQRDAWGEEPDQSAMAYRELEDLQDINGDGITDLVVRYAKTSGVLDRVNDYEIYYGGIVDGRLAFASAVNSLISADGTLAGLEFFDIDADGRQEVVVAGFDIGVSQIIRALVAGNIAEDVYIFRLDEDDKFPQKANFASTVKMTFSLSSAQRGDPIIKLIDLNGDGHSELLLSAGTDRLRIYLGRGGLSPFVRRPKKVNLPLPNVGRFFVGDDLNGDGRDDILFHYGHRDEQASPAQFVLLISASG